MVSHTFRLGAEPYRRSNRSFISMTMQSSSRPRPVVLCVLDGWGYRAERDDNGILQARTPNWRRFMETAPHALLQASELYVGLPRGQMGNSEVGHMNLGAG